MKIFLLCCGLSLCTITQAQIQVSSVGLRILNGHNGKPVKRADLIVRQTPARPYETTLDRRTDAAGRASLLIQRDAEIHAIVLHYPTCRTVKKADRKKLSTGYAVGQILTQGMVSENDCSKRTLPPTPGELILFVRPLHWWERMSY